MEIMVTIVERGYKRGDLANPDASNFQRIKSFQKDVEGLLKQNCDNKLQDKIIKYSDLYLAWKGSAQRPIREKAERKLHLYHMILWRQGEDTRSFITQVRRLAWLYDL